MISAPDGRATFAPTSTMTSPLIRISPGLVMWPDSTSSRRAACRTVRCGLGRACGCVDCAVSDDAQEQSARTTIKTERSVFIVHIDDLPKETGAEGGS